MFHSGHVFEGRAIVEGLLGSKFTLADIVSFLAADQMTSEADGKLSKVIAFMLHVRSTDYRKIIGK